MQNKNVIVNKREFLAALYEILYFNEKVKKVSNGDTITFPNDRFPDFFHDLGILVKDALIKSSRLED